MAKQPTSIIRGQAGAYEALAAKIASAVNARKIAWSAELTDSMTVRELQQWLKAKSADIRPAVRAAFAEAGLMREYSTLTSEAMLEAIVIGYGAAIPTSAAIMQPSALLSRKFGATIPLSKRIWESGKTAESEVMGVLSNGLRAQQAWTRTALDISAKELSSGNISGKIDELVTAAKRAGSSPAAIAEYKQA